MATFRAQFNLLPDIKLQFIQAERKRNLVVSISVLVSVVSIIIFLVTLSTVSVVQKKQITDADKKISTASTKLQALNGLDQVLTVQNQLQTLVGLHQNKHISSLIFTYLPEVTPTNVSIGRLSLNFSDNKIQLDGTAPNQAAVNTFIDTLKFTTFTIGAGTTPKTAFPEVIESSFGISAQYASYSLSVTFDPLLFSNSQIDKDGHLIVPALSVPKLTSTRSVVDDPSNVLFNGQFNNAPAGTPEKQ